MQVLTLFIELWGWWHVLNVFPAATPVAIRSDSAPVLQLRGSVHPTQLSSSVWKPVPPFPPKLALKN